ncbi:hypothetical protein GBA65_14910 [Rubrobacter marinus]|uniref:Uncharacterized protein n=1 Tax=Rubrobacter marinus TaxID=2653852 RepID=A0A6G8PZR2_9ACTN|nr:minor capsid protein [Rubrobacter marinus]QIN79597.1 hypothetical protein GBA65_14910 [Rubrobacter marinus]
MILGDVRAILQAGNIGWRVLENQIPASTSTVQVPDELVVLFAYQGGPPGHVKGMSAPVQRSPRFQVVCRSKSWPNAHAKAEQAYGLLAGYSGVVNETKYASIRALGEPFALPLDGDKARVAVNFEAVVT